MYLIRLINGHGGSITQNCLYFSYNNSFYHFLRTLQQETIFRSAPPFDLSTHTARLSNTDPESSCLSTSHDEILTGASVRKVHRSVHDSRDSHAAASSTSPPSAPNVPRNKEKGYTLDDGPWIYRLRNGTSNRGPYMILKDEKSYLKMIDDLKETRKKDIPPDSSIVMIIHVSYVTSTPSTS